MTINSLREKSKGTKKNYRKKKKKKGVVLKGMGHFLSQFPSQLSKEVISCGPIHFWLGAGFCSCGSV